MSLPRTSAGRLRAIALLFEKKPLVWDQDSWWWGPDGWNQSVADVAGQGAPEHCGTSGCVAGWAVALTPRTQVKAWRGWETAGADTLGLTDGLAEWLFDADRFHQDRQLCIETLRALAKLPERRSLRNAAPIIKRVEALEQGMRPSL